MDCSTARPADLAHRGTGGFACPPLSSSAGRADTPAKIRDAASQFEALLLAQMLKSVREAAGEGWLGTDGDEAGGLMLDVAQEHLAQVLAAQGGLGLASLVAEGLSRAPASKKP